MAHFVEINLSLESYHSEFSAFQMANNVRAGSTCSLLLVTEEADRQQLEAACASAGLTALDLPLYSSLEGKQMNIWVPTMG